jgi:hypothetical protein
LQGCRKGGPTSFAVVRGHVRDRAIFNCWHAKARVSPLLRKSPATAFDCSIHRFANNKTCLRWSKWRTCESCQGNQRRDAKIIRVKKHSGGLALRPLMHACAVDVITKPRTICAGRAWPCGIVAAIGSTSLKPQTESGAVFRLHRHDEAPKLDSCLGSGTVALISVPLAFRRSAACACMRHAFQPRTAGEPTGLSRPF